MSTKDGLRRKIDLVKLVQGLESLHDGDVVLGRIIAEGDRVIPALRSFLLDRKPSGVYEPRRWAVEGLGALGAKDVLLEYLSRYEPISNPVVRAGEEAVRNAAARELARWKTGDVFEALMRTASDSPSTGVIEAIASFARTDSIPLLDRALEDDTTREAAELGFRNLGSRARPALILSAKTRLPLDAEERPSSLRRRASALRLLADAGVSPGDWIEVRSLLEESNPDIVFAAADLAFNVAPREDQIAAGRAILRVLPSAGWDRRMNVPDQLARCFPELAQSVDEELRARLASKTAAIDSIVAVLQRAKKIAAERVQR
jgi:hypothetical protein